MYDTLPIHFLNAMATYVPLDIVVTISSSLRKNDGATCRCRGRPGEVGEGGCPHCARDRRGLLCGGGPIARERASGHQRRRPLDVRAHDRHIDTPQEVLICFAHTSMAKPSAEKERSCTPHLEPLITMKLSMSTSLFLVLFQYSLQQFTIFMATKRKSFPQCPANAKGHKMGDVFLVFRHAHICVE